MPRSVFGVYTAPTQVISAAAQTQVLAQLDVLKALIPGPTAPARGGGGHLDQVSPAAADQLRAEIDALKTAIDAAPTA